MKFSFSTLLGILHSFSLCFCARFGLPGNSQAGILSQKAFVKNFGPHLKLFFLAQRPGVCLLCFFVFVLHFSTAVFRLPCSFPFSDVKHPWFSRNPPRFESSPAVTFVNEAPLLVAIIPPHLSFWFFFWSCIPLFLLLSWTL